MPLIDVEKIKKAGDYIRYLSLFGIENAQSGHPGLPTGCADIGAVLFRYILKYQPSDPAWINRDRFVLSAGHGSILLYSLLHCSGYNYSLFDIANFRQLGSITPGHPEYDLSHGIETSTGPLGQGFANSVGMAIEQKKLALRFNKPNYPIFDYSIYTFLGDGCMMEGISYEAASIAGHLGLDNLTAIYDANRTTIDGSTDITFTEDVRKRFEAQGWAVENGDAEDLADFHRKLTDLKKIKGKPKLLIVKTTIGAGLDKMKGSNKIHGAPAGVDEVVYFIQNSRVKNLFARACGENTVENPELLKTVCMKNIGEKILPVESPDALSFMKENQAENAKHYADWKEMLEKYRKDFPADHDALTKFMNPSLPEELKKKLLNYKEQKSDATRGISGRILNLVAESMPQLIGGSADLAESTKASISSSHYITKNDFSGRNIAFGVREHAMGAIGNGLALAKAHLPFTSTFFTFFDYMKPAVRLASLMRLKQLFIFTHDSIYVGEDGPTHHPIEHLNALRLIPDLYTFRPANDIETAFAYLYYFDEMKGPAAIVCSRQKLNDELFKKEPDRKEMYDDFRKGAYLYQQTDWNTMPDVIIGASGSEMGLAVESAALLEKNEGKNVRIVSFPCLELFEECEHSYRDRVLCGGEVPFVFVEAASHRGVSAFYDRKMLLIQIQEFGISGPPKKIAEKFGMTGESVYKKIKAFIQL
jgi:transketolase